MNKPCYLIIFLFFVTTIVSQTKINGKIIDNNNEILSGANIIISNVKNSILTYAISNKNGNYNLNFSSKLDSINIEVTFMGYESQLKKVQNKSQTLKFVLKETQENLKEVIIKNIPIKKKGDTLSYNVVVFKDQKDRVIADVLKKMPGIEVLTDGKILYQGTPIQKYYIEGLDLLEGKYNLANNNLPASSVSKVQILENHQPIKILDSLVFTNKTSLNIKLKNKITTTGTAKVGVGISPFLWDSKVTPMLFSKKQQMISSYQTNNTGNDISTEIKYLTLEQLLDKLEDDSGDSNWLSIQELIPPRFAKKRWLDNNAHLISSNSLQSLNNNAELKVSLNYINDVQKQNGNTKTTFITPEQENVQILENTTNKILNNNFESKFILTKNAQKKYYKNVLEINKKWNSKQGFINTNLNGINQNLKIPNFSIRNKLKWILPIKKKLITIKSIVSFKENPQELVVNFNNVNLLNNQFTYDKLKQNLNIKSFYTNNSIGFTKKIKDFTIFSDVGFKLQNHKLITKLFLFDNNTTLILPNEYFNNLEFNKTSFFYKFKTQYVINNFKFDIKLPSSILIYNICDDELLKGKKATKFNFEPTLLITKQINTFWKVGINANIKNQFSDISQLYYGFIFNDYRNIEQFDNPILEKHSQNVGIRFSYRNAIKSFFFVSNYRFESSNQNLMSGIFVNSQGVSSYGFFEKNTNSLSHNFSLSSSKYINKIKTNFSLNTNFSTEIREQLLNENLVSFNTKNISIVGKINSEIKSWLSLGLKSSLVFNNINFEQNKNNTTTQNYLFDLSLYPSKYQYINFDVDYYKSNSFKENYFVNVFYRYTFKKSKIDLEFNWNNILNTNQYILNSNSSFLQIQSSYKIRPSQFLVTVKLGLENIF